MDPSASGDPASHRGIPDRPPESFRTPYRESLTCPPLKYWYRISSYELVSGYWGYPYIEVMRIDRHRSGELRGNVREKLGLLTLGETVSKGAQLLPPGRFTSWPQRPSKGI
jgi:hypothetical protein